MFPANVFEEYSLVAIDISIDVSIRIKGSGGVGFDNYLCYTPNTLSTPSILRTLNMLRTQQTLRTL